MRWGKMEMGVKVWERRLGRRIKGEGDEIEPSALRQCIIWRFHLLASIRGGCCAIKEVSEVCVPVCAYMCVWVHVCVLRVSRVVQCLIEQDGGSPPLIPLHFIGLDGPSYNCIRALSPPSPSLTPSFPTAVTTCHSPTHMKHTRRTSAKANFLKLHW